MEYWKLKVEATIQHKAKGTSLKAQGKSFPCFLEPSAFCLKRSINPLLH